MLNSKMIVSDPKNFNNSLKINPYYNGEKIDLKKAEEEHSELIEIFQKIGIEVLRVPSPRGSQDGVYTANWALIHNGKAVMSHLPPSRQLEVKYARKILAGLGYEIAMVPNQNWRFSGQGDSLICGDYVFCGKNYRSDVEAQEFTADFLNLKRIQLETIPKKAEKGKVFLNPVTKWQDSFFYDIDLALAIVKGPNKDSLGIIAYCPEAFTEESQDILRTLNGFQKIIVNFEEAKNYFACNLVSTGKDVVMSPKATKLRKDLERIGLTVHTPEVTELVKGGGYIRCVSLTLEN